MSGDISDKVIQTVIERVNESNSKFHLLKILQHRLDNLSAVMLQRKEFIHWLTFKIPSYSESQWAPNAKQSIEIRVRRNFERSSVSLPAKEIMSFHYLMEQGHPQLLDYYCCCYYYYYLQTKFFILVKNCNIVFLSLTYLGQHHLQFFPFIYK